MGVRETLAKGAMALGLLLATPALAQQAADTLAPEIASGTEEKAPVKARRQMVVAANPFAAEAGLKILREGGSAADPCSSCQR